MRVIGFGSILGRIDFLLRESANLAPEVMSLFFISKEDEAKTAFRCPGAVGRTILLAGDALRSE